MGNEICCQQTTSQERKQEFIVPQFGSSISQTQKNVSQVQIDRPQLSDNIKMVIDQQKPFYEQFNTQQGIRMKTFGKDVYEGPTDIIGRPAKIGKMYKQNGAFFIGNFVSGKAQGPCFYILKDGSFFKGIMKDNQAECENGYFVSKNFQYSGEFKNNEFHGKGKQKISSQNYSFEGFYENGKKKQGIMRWQNQGHSYVYEGPFDQNGQFKGKGKLVDPEGTYEGQFVNGQKHGYGVYFYKTQLRYEGTYSHNKKQGEGKLFNNDNTIAYKGPFKNGMPHGKGIATAKNGSEFQTQWIDGIDARLL